MADIRVRVGYCSDTTAKIGIAALTGETPVITCSGGTPVLTSWEGRGDDNPLYGTAPNGVYAGYAGYMTITGLSAFTTYTFTVSQNGITRSGSFKTLPADDTTDFAYFTSTCENHNHHVAGDSYSFIKAKAIEAAPTVLFYAHIDDNIYADNNEIDDTATGLATTGKPDITGLAWDYALAWMCWYGLIPSKPWARKDDRQWICQNLPLWAQWGDHEIEGDHCRKVADTGSSDGCDKTLELVAELEWDAFVSDYATPPKLRTGEQYWGAVIGPVRFVSYDSNLHSQPYNACDAGDTHSYGRSGTYWDGTCSGATVPTRTELGVLTDTQPTDFLGDMQLTDILNYFDNDEPFKVLLMSTGISALNQPWAEYWPDEWDDFCNRADVGIINNDRLNGATGHLIFQKGDSHAFEANRYEGNGTADVLGGAAAGKVFWEINAGTINGSWIGGNQGPLNQNGIRRYQKHGFGVNADSIFCGVLYNKITASGVVKEFECSLYELLPTRLQWKGIMLSDQTDNDFSVDTETSVAI